MLTRLEKSVLLDEVEEESGNFSGSYKSDFDEDPEDIVQKIFEEMKNSKEKAKVEDTEYVLSPNEASDSSHKYDDIPLKSHIEELLKNRKAVSSLNRKEGLVLRSQGKDAEKRPRKSSIFDPKESKVQLRSVAKKKIKEKRV